MCSYNFFKRSLLALLLAGGLVSCTGFSGQWREAAEREGKERDGLSGRWKGSWESGRDGHRGGLRCIVTPVSGQPSGKEGVYEFHFHASWGRILSGGWRVTGWVVGGAEAGWRFDGARKLGWGLGSYQFAGKIRDGCFRATYEGEQDRGVLDLRRP